MKLIAFLLLFLPFLSRAQFTDNAEMKGMYDADQSARRALEVNWDQLHKDDSARQIRTRQLLDSGKLTTGQDYYNAVMIFQHGEDTVASGLSVRLMKKALDLDPTLERWLLAAAIDRDLMRRGSMQIYGTQFVKRAQDAPWERYPLDSNQVSDRDRQYYHVETLAQQQEKLHRMNLITIMDFYGKYQSLAGTMQMIEAEHKKGDASLYDVDENSIDNFGYTLVSNKKLQDALKVFTLNTRLYPQSSTAYTSLGDCLMALNKRADALIAYRKALSLNIDNVKARRLVDELKNSLR